MTFSYERGVRVILVNFSGLVESRLTVTRGAPSGGEILRHLRQQVSIGGQRYILQALDFPEAGDEINHALAQQRFAASDANLADTQADKDATEAQELFPRQQIAMGNIILRIGRLAVDATEVAAVRHRNAQVVNFAPELIVQHSFAITANQRDRARCPTF